MVYSAKSDDTNTISQFTRIKYIKITTTGTSTPANYQVKLTIAYEPEMQADFSDIRFNTLGNVYIDYWIESKTDSVTSTVWVELPDAITDPGSDTIWMYYGNSDLGDGSVGKDTFLAFSDRSDVASWYGGDNPTDDGTSMKFYTTQANMYSNLDVSISETEYILEYYFKTISRVGTDNCVVITRDVDKYISVHWHPFVNTQNAVCWGALYTQYYGSYSEGTVYIGKIVIDENNKAAGVNYYIYNSSKSLLASATGKPFANAAADNITRISIGDGSGSATTLLDMRVWWIYLRKYIASEPTLSYGTSQHQRRVSQFIN